MNLTSNQIRSRFLEFFKKRGHVTIPSASLVPENDPSVLFNTAGMQQFKPYYVGLKDAQKDFGSLNTVSVQKCVRTSDIDEVGDESHLTFFEMLGNFSFGGYWKKEAIEYAHEFITSPNWMNLKIDYVSVFTGEDNVPADTESEEIWKSIDPNIVVKKYGRADNFWGPTGIEGPCGPTTEIYVDGIEIWNIVFNEYYQNADKSLRPLEIKGIDTGMGLERLAKVVQKVETVFETDLFINFLSTLPSNLSDKKKRILADHIRAISFMINDTVRPSNKGVGYVLRRLMRRILAQFEMEQIKHAIDWVTSKYKELDNILIREIIDHEWKQFVVALDIGMKELNKLENINSELAFRLYSSYGLPFDVMKDKFPELDIVDFEKKFEEHQEVSKAGSEQKFKGGLAGTGEIETKYHTVTHLLHQALRDVLGNGVEQRGSNITTERLRFDFTFPRKMTQEEIEKVEGIVNKKITEKLPIQKIVMKKDQAEKTGALHFFGEKYGDEVSVYFIGDSLENAYSKEFCGGPHVSHTGILASGTDPDGTSRKDMNFKIIKEEAISSGIRRVKAILK